MRWLDYLIVVPIFAFLSGRRATDLGLVLWAEPRPGHATVVTSDDGTVTIHDIALVALPLHRTGRPLGRFTVAPAVNA